MSLAKLLYLARFYLRAKLFNKRDPLLGGIKLTHRCNLQCKACPYWRRPGPELTYQQVTELMVKLYNSGVRLLIFEGGEPLLWRDGKYTLPDLIEVGRQYFFTIGVTTNGTLPLELATDIIWVSIDGLQETHDYLRGPSYEKIITNIQNSAHSNIFANLTINKINIKEIPLLVKALAPLVKGITIQFFFPYPESEDLALSREDRVQVLAELIKLKRAGYPIADSYAALSALQNNSWQCEPWMLANADPDGKINHGCYLLNRSPDDKPCPLCGFAAHTEISLAYQLNWQAMMAGHKILKIF